MSTNKFKYHLVFFVLLLCRMCRTNSFVVSLHSLHDHKLKYRIVRIIEPQLYTRFADVTLNLITSINRINHCAQSHHENRKPLLYYIAKPPWFSVYLSLSFCIARAELLQRYTMYIHICIHVAIARGVVLLRDVARTLSLSVCTLAQRSDSRALDPANTIPASA